MQRVTESQKDETQTPHQSPQRHDRVGSGSDDGLLSKLFNWRLGLFGVAWLLWIDVGIEGRGVSRSAVEAAQLTGLWCIRVFYFGALLDCAFFIDQPIYRTASLRNYAVHRA